MAAVVSSIVSLAFLSLCLAGSNKQDAPPPTDASTPVPNEDVDFTDAGSKAMLGTYVGPFGSHRITLCLQNLIDNSVNGFSVVAGNERAFSGSFRVTNGTDGVIHANEPGDHPEDGRFDFTYVAAGTHLVGTWTPNNKKQPTIKFDLARRNFKYDPKLGQYPQASTRVLKTADVENLRPEDLRTMRNEIYARHGYTFRLREMRDHFEGQAWYMPISFNVSTQLTAVELKNEALIKSYENYGADHYDAFGR